MHRSLFALSLVGVVAAAGAAHAVLGRPAFAAGPAGPAATENIAYDEIVKFIGTATPPPPGSFQTDYAAIMNPSASAAQATPAPRRKPFGNIGAIVGGIARGENPTEAVTSAAVDAAVGNAVQNAMARMLGGLAAVFTEFARGHVSRHTFFNGWERIDDPASNTATITECNLHQVIRLDLATKTYRVIDTNAPETVPAEPTGASAARTAPPAAPRSAPQPPGTVVLDVSTTGSALGAKTIDAVPTTGYASSFAITASQATGSCRNGSFAVRSVDYVSGYREPRAYCPLPVRYPSTPTQMVTGGGESGCRPTFTMHASGPTAPSGRLSLYNLLMLSGSSADRGGAASRSSAGSSSDAAQGGAGFSFLVERGNLRSVTAADAALFQIPAGFTKAP